MLWAVFCWDTLGPDIHLDVTLTRTTCLNIAADHIHPFKDMVFHDGSHIFQQDNVSCHKAKIVQEWFEEHQFKVLTSPDLHPTEHLWDVLDKQV